MFKVPTLTIGHIFKGPVADRFWRERRHPQWTLSYELFRDTVMIQNDRQSGSMSNWQRHDRFCGAEASRYQVERFIASRSSFN